MKEKRYFKSQCETLLAPHDYYSLKDLIDDFNSLIEKGVTHLEIDTEHKYGEDTVVVNLYEYREETDKEEKRRIAEDKRVAARLYETEYQTYLKLKDKYGHLNQ